MYTGGHNDLTSVDGDNYFAAVSTFITSNGNKEQVAANPRFAAAVAHLRRLLQVTQALPQAQKCCLLM